jgi:hypothetical protein
MTNKISDVHKFQSKSMQIIYNILIVVGEKKRLAFLDLMIESAQSGVNQITDHEIKEQVDTIMFEVSDMLGVS